MIRIVNRNNRLPCEKITVGEIGIYVRMDKEERAVIGKSMKLRPEKKRLSQCHKVYS